MGLIQLPWMLISCKVTKEEFIKVDGLDVEMKLTMLYYWQDMEQKMEPIIGQSKIHGEMHGEKKVM